jgi:TRAP transporter TAXI family solute receptor
MLLKFPPRLAESRNYVPSKKRALYVILSSALLCACDAGRQSDRAARQSRVIRFAWGVPGSPGSLGVKDAFEAYFPGARVEVQGFGSVENMLALQRDEVDLVLTFADVAYLGFVGRLPGVPQRLDHLRGVATLTTLPFQVVVRENLAVDSIRALKGRRVGVGPPGSACPLTADLVLHAYGLSLQDLDVHALGFDAASRELLDGTLDASFYCGVYPYGPVVTAVEGGGRLLQITGAPIEQLHADYPYVKMMSIPPGIYRNVDRIRTIGVDGLVATRSTLSESDVYKMTKAFYLALPKLNLRVDPSRAPATSVPLHAGAARYYREQELLR